MIDFISSEDKH